MSAKAPTCEKSCVVIIIHSLFPENKFQSKEYQGPDYRRLVCMLLKRINVVQNEEPVKYLRSGGTKSDLHFG